MIRRSIGWTALALLCAAAPAIAGGDQEGGLWLPHGASTYTGDVDFLYKVIFWVTTGMFFLVEGLLLLFCVLYRRRPGHRPHYTHGSNVAELTWTIIPGLMLLGLAVWQIPTWHKIKDQFPKPGLGVTEVDVQGEQFKWFYRYRLDSAQKATFETTNDVTAGLFRMPFGDTALVHLRSKDVIHSFFIPHMRVKQDAVPGLRNRIWFKPNRIQLVKLSKTGEAAPSSDFIWVDDPKEFEPGGKYHSSRIAVAANVGYQAFRLKDLEGVRANSPNLVEVYKKHKIEPGTYGPIINPGTGQPAKQRVLYQGQVLKGQDWQSCDYALGIFDIACAELCGAQHYTMQSFLIVEPRASFNAWLEEAAREDAEPEARWGLWKN